MLYRNICKGCMNVKIAKFYFTLGLIILLMPLLVIAGCSPEPEDHNTSQGFSFIYMGDSQADPETGDYTAWGELLETAARHESRPAFVMIGGDLVNDGSDQREWDAFMAAGGETLKKLPLYPATGNHDLTDLYKAIFDLPQNGPPGKMEAFYSFDYRDAHFTVMDSNAMGAANPEDLEWLKNDLSATDKTHKIVMFHHPAYPAINIPKDMQRAETIQKYFVPVMEEAGVDLVLSGHQHVYMRTYPLKKGVRDDDGIVYLMGFSGGKQYTPGSFEYAAASIGGKPVYTVITLNEKGIFLETRDSSGAIVDSNRGPSLSEQQKQLSIIVKGDGIDGEKNFSFGELAALPYSGFEHVYSTINNWPTPRFYAARGLTVRTILKAAEVLDSAQLITFRSPDGYEISFTREQLIGLPRYYYPAVKEGSAAGAERVESIIAYEYKEGSGDLGEAVNDSPCLIFGQSNPLEHTNPAFVVNVNEIIVSSADAEAWEPAKTFPAEGRIASGESVKLQHSSLGLLKLHYTLDGSDPTMLSPMYNVSTYQPELNKPIVITKDTVIKVLVTGYGKKDSIIKAFTFDAQ